MNYPVFFLSILFFFTFQPVMAQKTEKDGPKIVFKKTTYNYGNINAGADGNAVFEFKNTGNAPLIISSVTKSCGCIVPDWESKPVHPGQTGTITLKYDTNRIGTIDKYVTVASNAVNESVVALRIKGNVSGK